MTGARRLLIAVAVLGSGLILATSASASASAKPTTQTASFGGVTATFTFSGSAPTVSHPRLKIVRAGQQLYNQAVFSSQCGHECGPGAFGAHSSSVRVLDLQAGGPPDVVLELFSGGADCCFLDQVLSFDPGTDTYVKTERDFGYGAVLERLDHRWLFRSSDPSFICTFTDCADSAAPIQFWSFGARRFHNQTREHPMQIAADASKWLRLFKHHLANGVGLIAAWAGDEELLGHNQLVQSTLADYAAKGELRDGSGGRSTGKKFIAELNKLLRRLGYEH